MCMPQFANTLTKTIRLKRHIHITQTTNKKKEKRKKLCFSKVSRPYQSHQHALVTSSCYVHPEIKINRLILHCINHFIGSVWGSSLPFFICVSRCLGPKLFILCHSTFSYCCCFYIYFFVDFVPRPTAPTEINRCIRSPLLVIPSKRLKSVTTPTYYQFKTAHICKKSK